MNKADKYFKELLQDINENGVWSKEPRTRWADGEKAHYKSVYHKSYTYDISKGEFPITTLRKTALRGCFEEMRWIYQLQSNVIEDAHSCINLWWKDFVVDRLIKRKEILHYFPELFSYYRVTREGEHNYKGYWTTLNEKEEIDARGIGETYGKIVAKYDLMNKLLYDLEHNPDSRRKMISLWDNQSQKEDPKALPPCCYQTNWIVRDVFSEIILKNDLSMEYEVSVDKPLCKYVDLTLFQRSRDSITTFSINPLEYSLLLLMVCGHLTYKSGVPHKPGVLTHHVEDEHVYDRNMWAVEELLEKQPTGLQPKVELICEPKDFYEYRWEDFKFTGLEGIEPLSGKLEIAI